MSVNMIKITDDSGKRWLINLAYINAVQFPSLVQGLEDNLNTELLYLAGGTTVQVALGTWDAALADLKATYDDNPQPSLNVAPELYIATTL